VVSENYVIKNYAFIMATHDLLAKTFRIIILISVFCFTLIIINVYLVSVNINLQVSLDVLYSSGNTTIKIENTTEYCTNLIECSKILRSVRKGEFALISTKLYIKPNTYSEIAHYTRGTLYISLGISLILITSIFTSCFIIYKTELKL